MEKQDKIFKHVDPDTDSLDVWPNYRGLRFKVSQEDDAANVDLDPAAVYQLHEAIGMWLSRNGLIAQPTVGLSALPDADAIRALAREEFEKLFNDRTRPAVLPLWESPASGAVSRPCPGCTPLGCTDFSHDGPLEQEPWDVPEPLPGRCGCGHTRIQHSFAECMVAECTCKRTRTDLSTSAPDPADVPEVIVAPRLMNALRRRNASAPTRCERCSHPHGDHDDEIGCTYGYGGMQGKCECTWSPR